MINYEAVKVRIGPCMLCFRSKADLAVQNFGNEEHEVAQYDKALAAYEKSSTKIATSLAFLNSGQNVIFSSALTGIMFMAAQGVVNGARCYHLLLWLYKLTPNGQAR